MFEALEDLGIEYENTYDVKDVSVEYPNLEGMTRTLRNGWPYKSFLYVF